MNPSSWSVGDPEQPELPDGATEEVGLRLGDVSHKKSCPFVPYRRKSVRK